ncbi:heme anaerobic degradation radical SAM methyltransferase ChuW/HutW [Halomonas campisalis]|uniref:Heme anaerobic degradation radical SAM methyltransferase ChuW/HutW n=1 Tax=Billgrantia campisalis TaxID=74661 RepID=A0ABS9PC49_9GAMM|nr:heme anaerobic degradation radical SAM methyltransferase ChuW/HutW [Halomonas campisalis]MCG6658807.1 heme anaerobic degradation radical SAM methyltransferase ChuW/HutW [Halomonas campisalis]MDR5864770.1 heme anaerobic degradation radical SAM methyltransferase ChuW/HutW [Halomonas campisalis]
MSLIASTRAPRRAPRTRPEVPQRGTRLPRLGVDPLTEAFASREPLMPWRDKRPVARAEVARLWRQLEDARRGRGKRLAYVHVPFCANHCLFCGFYRNKYRPEDSARYTRAVIDEVRRDADTQRVGRAPIHALYLGGGTPTALETPDLVRLIEALREALPLAGDCELTLEGRILHFDDEKVDACLDAGINRISIGVQSFDTQVRRQQGRRASGPQAERFIADLIERDRAAVVIDLMYGLPDQDESVWARDIETALALGPDGLDAYCLALFPGTPLYQAVAKGKVEPPASLAEQGRRYAAVSERLADAGWHQVSNSHWARTTRERNLYNLLIKSGAETLAFGSGAGGSLGRYSYSVDPDLQAYLMAGNEGRKPLSGMLEADSLQPLRDWVAGSLETARLDMGELRRRWPRMEAMASQLDGLVRHWESAGLAHCRNGVVRLTTAGRFWSTNLIAGFNRQLVADGPAPGEPGSEANIDGIQPK